MHMSVSGEMTPGSVDVTVEECLAWALNQDYAPVCGHGLNCARSGGWIDNGFHINRKNPPYSCTHRYNPCYVTHAQGAYGRGPGSCVDRLGKECTDTNFVVAYDSVLDGNGRGSNWNWGYCGWQGPNV